MNPSKRHKRIETIAQLVLILPLLFYFLWYVFDMGKWSQDARVTYAHCIGTGELTNWHSATFMFEGHMLYSLLHDALGLPVTAHTVLITMALVMGFALTAALSAILHWLMKRDLSFSFFALSSPFFVIFFKSNAFMNFGLDFYFMGALVICTAALLYLKHPRRAIRFVAQVAFWLLLFHIPEFRKNGILTVPFFAFAWMYLMFRHLSLWKSAAASVLVTCLAGLAAMGAPKIIPNVEIRHPQMVMMACDMKIAALCRGEVEQELARQREVYKIWHSLVLSEENWDVRADYVGPVIDEADPSRDTSDEFDWPAFREDYLRHWREYPASMISARAIQSFNFFTQNYTPKWLQHWWNERWPALAEGRDAWSTTNIRSSSTLFRNVLMLVLAGMLVYSLLRFMRRRFMSAPERLALFLGVVSWVYSLSFLIVVPTSDKRYHIPSALLCLMSLFIFGVVLWREYRSRKQQRESSPKAA